MSTSSSATTATQPVEWLDRDAARGGDRHRRLFRRPPRHAAPAISTRSSSRRASRAPRPRGRGAHLSRARRAAATRDGLPCRSDATSGFRGEPRRPSGRRRRSDVSADIVILAGNGYLDGIDAETEARVMPIDNYILATAPIGAGKPGGIIPGGEAVSDTRFVVYYFRPTWDGRLVFGGGETYSRAAAARPRRLRPPPPAHGSIPQLADVAIDYAWGGTLAITLKRLPFIRRVRPGVYAAAGYSGQGVALAPFAGKVLADAIRGDPARLDRFAALPVPPFPGGKLLRYPALVAGMSWYALRDRL